jgi:peptidyl-dipeptidase A
LLYAGFRQSQYNEFFRDAVVEDYQDEQMRRQLADLKNLGTAVLSTENYSALSAATSRMSNAYNLAKICPYQQPDCDLSNSTIALTLDPRKFCQKSQESPSLHFVHLGHL